LARLSRRLICQPNGVSRLGALQPLSPPQLNAESNSGRTSMNSGVGEKREEIVVAGGDGSRRKRITKLGKETVAELRCDS